jgi:hypothetical protein
VTVVCAKGRAEESSALIGKNVQKEEKGDGRLMAARCGKRGGERTVTTTVEAIAVEVKVKVEVVVVVTCSGKKEEDISAQREAKGRRTAHHASRHQHRRSPRQKRRENACRRSRPWL